MITSYNSFNLAFVNLHMIWYWLYKTMWFLLIQWIKLLMQGISVIFRDHTRHEWSMCCATRSWWSLRCNPVTCPDYKPSHCHLVLTSVLLNVTAIPTVLAVRSIIMILIAGNELRLFRNMGLDLVFPKLFIRQSWVVWCLPCLVIIRVSCCEISSVSLLPRLVEHGCGFLAQFE